MSEKNSSSVASRVKWDSSALFPHAKERPENRRQEPPILKSERWRGEVLEYRVERMEGFDEEGNPLPKQAKQAESVIGCNCTVSEDFRLNLIAAGRGCERYRKVQEAADCGVQ